MKQSKINYYNSIGNIPVWNFYKAKSLKDLRYYIKGFDEDSDLELTEKQIEELTEIDFDIAQDYIDAMSDGKGRSDLLILGQIGDLEAEIFIVGSLISMVRLNPSEALKNALSEWKYPTDIEGALKKLKSTKFRLSILKSKNKHLFDKGKEDEIEYDIYKDVVLLEQALEKNNIDVKTTVLEKWINYLKVAKEKNEKLRNNGK